jgi:S-adenosylmethionine:tRNA ribosyltransferase-isomerase
VQAEGEGSFLVRFSRSVDYEDLPTIGEIPLPKYIRREPEQGLDEHRYQTVYSKSYGAVAAPTAGLHFTNDIIGTLKKKGTHFVPLTLDVDWGTFKPVREKDYRLHTIHEEHYVIPESSAAHINRCRSKGRRIVCVGTTSVRALESASDAEGAVMGGAGETDLYIYPGYVFKVVQAMITNFHMPDSTLILLVAAFAGKQNIERAYRHAVAEGYRFFSYGDAMFIRR